MKHVLLFTGGLIAGALLITVLRGSADQGSPAAPDAPGAVGKVQSEPAAQAARPGSSSARKPVDAVRAAAGGGEAGDGSDTSAASKELADQVIGPTGEVIVLTRETVRRADLVFDNVPDIHPEKYEALLDEITAINGLDLSQRMEAKNLIEQIQDKRGAVRQAVEQGEMLPEKAREYEAMFAGEIYKAIGEDGVEMLSEAAGKE